jgi:hypothetical protein
VEDKRRNVEGRSQKAKQKSEVVSQKSKDRKH